MAGNANNTPCRRVKAQLDVPLFGGGYAFAGEIGGPPRAHQLEMRASWTAEGIDLSTHVEAFAKVLALVAGLPPEGVAQLGKR